MVRQCGNLLEADEVLFKASKFIPQFVLAPLCSFLNLKLDRISLLQLELEIDSTGYPDDHNSDSESSRTSSEPASSHPRPWTSKTKV